MSGNMGKIGTVLRKMLRIEKPKYLPAGRIDGFPEDEYVRLPENWQESKIKKSKEN